MSHVLITTRATGSAYVAYDSILEDADTISATSEDAAWPDTNLANWILSRPWVAAAADATIDIDITPAGGSPVGVQAWGVMGHNLGAAGATIRPYYSVNGGTDWVAMDDAVVPDSTECIFRILDASVTGNKYRLRITGSDIAPIIGCLFFGPVLQLYRGMEPGFIPPNLAREPIFKNNDSEDGPLLGRSIIAQRSKTSIKMGLVDPDWVRDYWLPFMRHYERQPFFFAWDYESYPTEVAYCYTDKGRVDKPVYTDPTWMRVEVDFVALTE